MIMTTGAKQTKIWNVRSGACIRTLDSGYGLCGMFLPGNRHIVIGTKTGLLEMYEISSATAVERIQAHDGTLWSISANPNNKGFVTGGSDKDVKFWEYQVKRTKQGIASVGLLLAKEMKMTDEVLCVSYSANGKWVAVGLLDSTVKVFFEDSLRFYLSLYGHKLPIMCIDVSDDSTLLASGGADKDLKIWGLDFGDCHKSLFAHDDSVMSVRFLPNTHYVVTTGKDKMVKFWDADKFEMIMTLSAHHAEVWSVAVAREGNMMVTVSNDRSIRVWEQTDEMVFVELERRKELEAKLEEEERVGPARPPGAIEGSGLNDAPESAPVATGSDKKSMVAAERLMEAMEVVKIETKRWEEYRAALAARERMKNQKEEKPTGLKALFQAHEASMTVEEIKEPIPNPILKGKTCAEYIFEEMKDISAASRIDALTALPFKYASMLLKHCQGFMDESLPIEPSVQAALFLAQAHRDQIMQSRELMEIVAALRSKARRMVRGLRDEIGENVAGIRHRLRASENKTSHFYFAGGEAADAGGAAPAARALSRDNPFVIDKQGTHGSNKRQRLD
eukprot:CAMPEP_0167781288 /NCGR_PEP_ID=MMETSP0111_2-20121227/5850_1 /TAXON_ID=91324 /ORGANISM="Lotharella globosa, Strain CCCM811" /LENGTH=561 /DNA_ID=CAMNT_0007671935 /DNA_START=12 /DNA_END=1697 /DNA_ORIENTATION=+